MRQFISPGVPLPDTAVAEVIGGSLVKSSTRALFAGKRVILIGAPAAFSPICSRIHLPGFVERAPDLLASGFDLLACIAANDPWVMAAWAETVDPARRISFLSDGNLQFGRTCCLTVTDEDYFIGTRLKRFTMIVNGGIVERCAVEDGAIQVTCSGAAQFCGPARPARPAAEAAPR